MTEQKELLRKAEASLLDAEKRAALVKKWEQALQQAVFEYHGSIRRIKDLASGDVPRAMFALERMIDALEAYLRVAPPTSSSSGLSPFDAIADSILGAESTPSEAPASPAPQAEETPSETTEGPSEPPEDLGATEIPS